MKKKHSVESELVSLTETRTIYDLSRGWFPSMPIPQLARMQNFGWVIQRGLLILNMSTSQKSSYHRNQTIGTSQRWHVTMARRRWPLAIPGPISCQHTLPPATTGQCGLANNISFTNLCTLSTCHRSEHALLGGYKQFILGRATDKRSPSKSKVRRTFSRRLQRS